MANNKKLIAFYLPQFHPTPRNDEWWGKGFTEWTNVGKAKPLFPGHYQPHVPADLGYYDLRLPEARKAQADMAREYGVYGFCYYHYWFENGFEELEKPFDEVVRLGEPDFPFCLCWANESWYSKFWNIDGTIDKKILAEQKYLGKEDNEAHFYRLLPAFKDKRYIKVEDKQLFVIYKPLEFIGLQEFMDQWNDLAMKNGLKGFYFIAYTTDVEEQYEMLKAMNFDSIVSCYLGRLGFSMKKSEIRLRGHLQKIMNRPNIRNYGRFRMDLISKLFANEDVIPSIVPNWDHTPRSGVGGSVFINSSPEQFDLHVQDVSGFLDMKENKLCFLKSWNEWGEGNYVEPDLKFGKGYLEVIKKYFA